MMKLSPDAFFDVRGNAYGSYLAFVAGLRKLAQLLELVDAT